MLEPSEKAVNDGLSVLFVDRFCEGDAHRTGLHTVLRVAAIGDSIVAHDAFQPIFAIHLTAWMHVEQADLGDRLWSNVVVAFVLRTCFKAATTGHAS